jgi:sodium-dependent dicarboxylate transporter 2/3/5
MKNSNSTSTSIPPAAGGSPNKAAWIGFFAGIVCCLAVLILPPPEGLSLAGWHCLGITLLIPIWWATEALPIPVTSLMPIILIPLLGIDTLNVATAPYANNTIYLFMGGFIIGLAMEKSNLHKRIALTVLAYAGARPSRQLAGFMIATAFLSMWVSNSATAIMMLPIATSVAAILTAKAEQKERDRYTCKLMLAIAYAASIGGIATIIGTPPNAILAGYVNEHYKLTIGFGTWMMIGLPIAVIMLLILWIYFVHKPFNLGISDSSTQISQLLKELGPMRKEEKMVLIVFVCTALLWIFRPLLTDIVPGLSDTVIAILAAVTLFIIPLNAKHRVFVMDWKSAVKMPWGVLLLFGGGLSLGAAINKSGLATYIASNMGFISNIPLMLTIILIVVIVCLMSEFTSNTATASTFMPLLGAIAGGAGIEPMLLLVPATFAASFCFVLPVSTPPNAIVFASGSVRMKDMIRTGAILNLIGVFVISLVCYALVAYLFIK